LRTTTRAQHGVPFILACLTALLLLGPFRAEAQDQRLPVKTRVAILLKALTYDHNLKTRCPEGLRIGVIGMAGNEASLSVANETLAEIRENSGIKVSGLTISAELIAASALSDIKGAVASKRLNILYISPGLDPMLDSISRMAVKKKILTLSGEASHAQSGAAITAVLREQKPKILVNTEAATQQGATLDARLLRLAEVVQPAAKYQPPDVIKKRRIQGHDPLYPAIARTAKKEAKIVVKIYITPDGDVGKIKFMKSDPYFEDEVKKAIQTWKFSPHKINNHPVGTYTVYKFDFKLD
jgi:TonB family protein